MHEEMGLEAIVTVVLWIVGVGLSVIAFVALIQLFSIAKSLRLILAELRTVTSSGKPELTAK